jgi:hypothetical protein
VQAAKETTAMANQNLKAKPLLGFRILQSPEHPTIPLLTIKTSEGETIYLVTKEILLKMSQEMTKAAGKVPSKRDQN